MRTPRERRTRAAPLARVRAVFPAYTVNPPAESNQIGKGLYIINDDDTSFTTTTARGRLVDIGVVRAAHVAFPAQLERCGASR